MRCFLFVGDVTLDDEKKEMVCWENGFLQHRTKKQLAYGCFTDLYVRLSDQDSNIFGKYFNSESKMRFYSLL